MNKTEHTTALWKAVGVLAFFGLVSRAFGLLRDRILASHFGASPILDTYYSAFRIPDFIFNLIISGAIASAVIPIFISYYKEDEERGWLLINHFLNFALILVFLLSVVFIIFAPWLMPFITPGFPPAQLAQAIQLTRLMFLSPLIFTFSTVIGAVLQSLRRFTVYSIAPLLYNLGIIIGAVYLVPIFGILGLGYGVVLGAILHLIVQIPVVYSAGFRWRFLFSLRDKGLRKIITLMVPRTLGLASGQINLVVINAIASTVAVGSITIINFANNLWIVPISIIGIAIPTAVFPSLSDLSADHDRQQFLATFNHVFRHMLCLGIPATVVMIVLRQPIIQLILGVGRFSIADIEITAAAIAIFALGIVPFSLEQLVNRAFYAMHHTGIPVIMSIIADIVNVILSLLFVHQATSGWLYRLLQAVFQFSDGPLMRVLGLSLALTLANIVNFVLLWIGFRSYVRYRGAARLSVLSLKLGIMSIAAAACLIYTNAVLALPTQAFTFLGQFLLLSLDLLIFIIYGIMFAWILKIEELREVHRWFKKIV